MRSSSSSLFCSRTRHIVLTFVWFAGQSQLLVTGFSISRNSAALSPFATTRKLQFKSLNARRDDFGRQDDYYYYDEDDDDDIMKRRQQQRQQPDFREARRRQGVGENVREVRNMNYNIEYENNIDNLPLSRPQGPSSVPARPSPRRQQQYYDDDYDYYDDDDYEDEYWDDDNNDDDYEGKTPASGNYWSNPRGGIDDYDARRRRRRRPISKDGRSRDPPPSVAAPRRRPGTQKTTFRSGTPAPPAPIAELYNNLFWYGFDPTDISSPADPTMFGGTKGKFNGLSYLYDGVGVLPPAERGKRRPRNFNDLEDDIVDNQYNDYDDEYWEDDTIVYNNDDDDDDDDDEIIFDRPKVLERKNNMNNNAPRPEIRRPSPPVTPPYDPPRPMTNDDSIPRRQPPQRDDPPAAAATTTAGFESRRRRNPDDDYPTTPNNRRRRPRQGTSTSNDWVSNEVSTWFQPEDANYEDDYSNRKSRRQSRQQQQRYNNNNNNNNNNPMWSPLTNAFDTFLGVDREQMKSKAELYDEQMGLKKKTSTTSTSGGGRSSSSTSRRRPRRPGYAYRYDRDDEDDVYTNDNKNIRDEYDRMDNDSSVPEIIDAEPIIEEVIIDKVASSTSSPSQPQSATRRRNQETENGSSSTNEINRKELSWEERSLAMERVPPANVAAWGPTGDMGIDARTKALSDALEDISASKANVKQREAKVAQAREEIMIMRVDLELEGKRLRASGVDPRRINQRLRRMERKIEDAGRTLRYEQIQFEAAKDELAEIEARHWALLRFYDPNRAGEVMADALREFEEMEPAVRRIREKNSKNDNSDN